MTNNYNQFVKVVEKKFGAVKVFSMALNGKYKSRSLSRLQFLEDIESNRIFIQALIDKCNEMEYDPSSHQVTSFDVNTIKSQVRNLVDAYEEKEGRKVFTKEVLEDLGIPHPYYSNVVNKKNKVKGKRYYNMCAKLGI